MTHERKHVIRVELHEDDPRELGVDADEDVTPLPSSIPRAFTVKADPAVPSLTISFHYGFADAEPRTLHTNGPATVELGKHSQRLFSMTVKMGELTSANAPGFVRDTARAMTAALQSALRDLRSHEHRLGPCMNYSMAGIGLGLERARSAGDPLPSTPPAWMVDALQQLRNEQSTPHNF